MGYMLVIVAAVIVCVLSALSEVVHGNIVHIQNGREPDAGSSLMLPLITLPLIAVAFAWLLNLFSQSLGFYVVAVLFAYFLVSWVFSFRNVKREFAELMRQRQDASDA